LLGCKERSEFQEQGPEKYKKSNPLWVFSPLS
jgi:hypothetical protein